jgi:hypothetical protein
MGHLKSLELSDPERPAAAQRSSTNDLPTRSAGNRVWVWLVVAGLAIAGFWYYRSSHSKVSQNPSAAGAPGQPRPGGPSGAHPDHSFGDRIT